MDIQPGFELIWSDLSYKIKPDSSESIWNKIEQRCRRKMNKCLYRGSFDSYDLKPNEVQQITILRNLNGSFKSGELIGILGPSGAGKTSLLNFISRRREEGYTGRYEADCLSRPLKISSIPQHDYLPDYLTVRENLEFASHISSPKSNQDHKEDISKIANLLGLVECLDVPTKNISGGQHKRLAIAQELLTKPDILILDEPTSGLDSLTCQKTIAVLKDLVESSKKGIIDPLAIVLTIHQPQQDVFNMFDRVYVMASGGIVIYDGPPEVCQQVITEHTSIQLPYADYNSATFAVDIAAEKYGLEPVKALYELTKRNFKQRNRNKMAESAKKDKQISIFGHENNSQLFIDSRIERGSAQIKGRFFGKTLLLSKRYYKSIIRDPKLIPMVLLYIILPASMGVFMGQEPGRATACPKFKSHYELSEFAKEDNNLTRTEIQDELALTLENLATLFTTIYGTTAASIACTTLVFSLDLEISLKEHFNGWYSMSSYLLARLITDIPLTCILPILCMAVCYPVTGQMSDMNLGDSHRILITAVALILGSMVGQVLGMIVGAVYIGHLTTAMFVSQGLTLPLVFLSGFVVRTKNMSKVVYALSYTSLYRHMLEVAIAARYGYGVCRCNETEITGQNPEIAGVSDKLRKFIAVSFADEDDTGEDDSQANDTDLFQTLAKQVSLYNTYGVEIRSCKDVVPHQLVELSITEANIPIALTSLAIQLSLLVIVLFITTGLVVKMKNSL